MTVLQKADFTCPVCTRQFQSEAVVSTNSFGGKRTDFHERAAGTQPLPYFVHVCPECGFAGKKDMFKEIDLWAVGERVKAELTPLVKSTAKLTCSEKYEMAAKVAMWNGESNHYVGEAYLRAAWCCVDEGDIEAERFYRLRAAEWYTKALTGFGEVPEDEAPQLQYLVGELWRRIGDLKKAKWWFNTAIESATKFPQLQWVVDAAKQQRDYPREWFG